MESVSVPAQVWSAYVAKEVKTKEADNPSQYILMGTELLDKETFNTLNDSEHAVVHGVQVLYGPFSSKKDMETFVAEYAGSDVTWPGHNHWKYVKVGKPHILSPLFDPSRCDIVHNTSLEFQGQLEINEQQRRIEEIENMQKKLKERENNTQRPLTSEDLETRIRWVEKDIERREKDISQERQHLDKLLKMRK